MNSDKRCMCGAEGEDLEMTTRGLGCWSCIEESYLDDHKGD